MARVAHSPSPVYSPAPARAPAPASDDHAYDDHAYAGRARRAHGLRQARAAERRADIVELLRERRSVRVSSLSAALGVSQMTIRRDLERLDGEGLATRAYGGALARG
jgi:DNA-binding transcriptional ArsR family regulator